MRRSGWNVGFDVDLAGVVDHLFCASHGVDSCMAAAAKELEDERNASTEDTSCQCSLFVMYSFMNEYASHLES